jgi:hypothetical protein
MKIHIFLTSTPNEHDLSASSFGHFTPRERTPDNCWIGSWVRPRGTGQEDEDWIQLPCDRPLVTQVLNAVMNVECGLLGCYNLETTRRFG